MIHNTYLNILPPDVLQNIYILSHKLNYINVLNEMNNIFIYSTDNILTTRLVNLVTSSNSIDLKEINLTFRKHILCLPSRVYFKENKIYSKYKVCYYQANYSKLVVFIKSC